VQGRIVQQWRELGGVGHGQRLKVQPLRRPAEVKVDHSSTITAGQSRLDAPGARQDVSAETPCEILHKRSADAAEPASTMTIMRLH
jgi:hypothetical protein